MSDDQWITFDDVVELVSTRLDVSIGRAEFVTKTARASGEVRTRSRPIDDNDLVLLTNDDGLMSWNQKPGAAPNTVTRDRRLLFSKDDLLDWLGRHERMAEPAHLPDPDPEPPALKTRKRYRRTRAEAAIKALWGDTVPDPTVLSNALLLKKVSDWLKADCQQRQIPVDIPSDETILRAASRK